MQRIGKIVYSTLLLTALTLLAASCERPKEVQQRWFQTITTNDRDYHPHLLLLEYQSSYRVDSLTRSGDTLWCASPIDSAGIVSVIDSAGELLHAFVVHQKSKIVLKHDSVGFRIISNDSMNIALGSYYKAETQYKRELKNMRDSALLKKVSTDSIPNLWKRQHPASDSLWQQEVLHFVRLHRHNAASAIPLQSYLLHTQNDALRDSVRPLLNKELMQIRFVQLVQ